jgi:hypothetical protein
MLLRTLTGATLFALSLATPAYAQHRPLLLPGVSFGTPLRIAAGLAVFVPTKVEGGARTRGFIVEGSAGQGGARGSFGFASYLEYMGIDFRGVFLRTGASPRGASAEATYAGAEAGLTIAYVHLSAGVAQRLAGPDGDHRTIFTWSASIEIPIKP